MCESDDPDPGLQMLPIDEAIRRARPWRRIGNTGLEDVTDEEWDAFTESLRLT